MQGTGAQQMNPLFYFNCLNSLNWFIINNRGRAADYLTKSVKLNLALFYSNRVNLCSAGR